LRGIVDPEFYLAKLPLVHCGLDASPNQVNKVAGGCRYREKIPKKSAEYERAISIVASVMRGFSVVRMNLDLGPNRA
jgi:hypothetical protein